MDYTLRRPCPNCPFRTDIVQPRLSPAHASKVKAMVRAIMNDDMTFACHKTNCVDEQGEALDTEEVQFCAGAMILLEKSGRSHAMLGEAARQGEYDASLLDTNAPVYESMEDMLADMDCPTYGATPAETELHTPTD